MEQIIAQHTTHEHSAGNSQDANTSFLEAAMQTGTPQLPARILPNTKALRRTADADRRRSYANIRSRLVMRLMDELYDEVNLMDRPSTPCGPFTLLYDMRHGNDATTPVTNEHLAAWGVSREQLHADAMEAERAPLVWKPPAKGPRPHFSQMDHHDSDPYA